MSRSVLIVDDDQTLVALIAAIVAGLGIESVTTAADASQALASAQEARPDTVLVDLGLPDRDGLDLAYELSNLPWRPRVIVTSSDAESLLALERRDGGQTLAFIAKEELAGDTFRRALLDG